MLEIEKIIYPAINLFVTLIVTMLWNQMRNYRATQDSRHKEHLQENEAIKLGMQALLRDRIIQSYNYHTGKGYMPIYAKDSLENIYKNYEALGANGVIDNLVKELRMLPHSQQEIRHE